MWGAIKILKHKNTKSGHTAKSERERGREGGGHKDIL